jgi:hypothetical protein
VIDDAAARLLGLRFPSPDQLFSNSRALFFRLRAKKSGRQDLNLRSHGPEPIALRRKCLTQTISKRRVVICSDGTGHFRRSAGICWIYRGLSPILCRGRVSCGDAIRRFGSPLRRSEAESMHLMLSAESDVRNGRVTAPTLSDMEHFGVSDIPGAKA